MKKTTRQDHDGKHMTRHILLLLLLVSSLVGCASSTTPRRFESEFVDNTTPWSLSHTVPEPGIPYLQLSELELWITPDKWTWYNFRSQQIWEMHVAWLSDTRAREKRAFPISFCVKHYPHVTAPKIVKIGPIEKIELITNGNRYTATLRAIGPTVTRTCQPSYGCVRLPTPNTPESLTLSDGEERCYYADFPTKTPPDNQKFQLHVPDLEVDGKLVRVPALNFLFIPERNYWCFLVECLISH